jgi:hypothetical protein
MELSTTGPVLVITTLIEPAMYVGVVLLGVLL